MSVIGLPSPLSGSFLQALMFYDQKKDVALIIPSLDLGGWSYLSFQIILKHK